MIDALLTALAVALTAGLLWLAWYGFGATVPIVRRRDRGRLVRR